MRVLVSPSTNPFVSRFIPEVSANDDSFLTNEPTEEILSEEPRGIVCHESTLLIPSYIERERRRRNEGVHHREKKKKLREFPHQENRGSKVRKKTK